jgi:hypothetical protein
MSHTACVFIEPFGATVTTIFGGVTIFGTFFKPFNTITTFNMRPSAAEQIQTVNLDFA